MTELNGRRRRRRLRCLRRHRVVVDPHDADNRFIPAAPLAARSLPRRENRA